MDSVSWCVSCLKRNERHYQKISDVFIVLYDVTKHWRYKKSKSVAHTIYLQKVKSNHSSDVSWNRAIFVTQTCNSYLGQIRDLNIHCEPRY